MRSGSRDLIIGVASGLAAAWVMNAFQKGWSAIRKRQQENEGEDQGSPQDSEPTTV